MIDLAGASDWSAPAHRDKRPTSLPGKLLLFSLLVLLQWLATRALIDVGREQLPASWTSAGWRYGYLSHVAQLMVAMTIISILRPLPGFDPGIRWPAGRSYIGLALAIGIGAGVLMLLVDNGPDIIAMRSPEGPYDLRLANVVPWLVMQGAFVGVSEEIPFRSLFLAYLISVLPNRLKVRRTEISFATLVTALVFSLAHVPSFWQEPLAAAVGQQVYVIGLGIFYGWLFERSGSVAAPIVAHNAGDFVEWCLLFVMRAAWS